MMLRSERARALVAVAAIGTASCAAGMAEAQAAEPWEAACIMTYLDPNGDGFLSIRTGPASSYPEIARVRNGDSLPIDTRECRGKWCYATFANVNGKRVVLNGWFHTGWCQMIP